MKKHFFTTVEIDRKTIVDFLQEHYELTKFIKIGEPFFVRISKKPYPGLIHTVISQDQNNDAVVQQWMTLLKIAKKITPEKIHQLSWEKLSTIVGQDKATLIKRLTVDVLENKLDFDKLQDQDDLEIVTAFNQYSGLSLNSIRQFLIFSFFKRDVLCDTDPDFINGLKIFLNKSHISQQDINDIAIKYKGQLTLFTLFMWKINNERSGK